jgi:hypothetical protein
MEIEVLLLRRKLSGKIDSFVTGTKQLISYVKANKDLRFTACDKLNCWWQSVRPIAKVTRGLYNLSTFLVLTWTIFSFNFYVRTWKKGSSGLSTRPLIPCVGSELSSLEPELDVYWTSEKFWMPHTGKQINYVNFFCFNFFPWQVTHQNGVTEMSLRDSRFLQMGYFRDMTSYSLVHRWQCFVETNCPHIQCARFCVW